MSPANGTRLGPYEILSPLGAGGMGEVYRAKDTRLGRDVAVKVLPAEFASDPERLRRFEQEARAAAALNHPNILVLYDIGSAVLSLRGAEGQACPEEERSDDVGEAISPHSLGLPRPQGGLAVTEEPGEPVHYIVTELLEGETLRERLRGGPIPPAKAVDVGVQIVQGLAAAHEKGIVHRDLKPENLWLTKDGRIKILDFGLARLRLAEPAAHEIRSETPTSDSPTREGKVLGTPGYMSPEQVRGKDVDQRTDLFAFGVVLYEMLAGKRAFSGVTAADTQAAILTKDPDPLPPITPPGLDRVVKRCLEKRLEDRFLTAHELLVALEVTSSSPVSPAPAHSWTLPTALREPKRLWIVAACTLAAVLMALIGFRWHQRSSQERWLRQEALPKLEGIVDRIQVNGEGREGWDAFVLAREIDAVAPGDPLVERLRPKFTTDSSITSDPPGATVTLRYYDEPDAAPIVIGRTPLEHVPCPKACTRLQLTLVGHPPLDDVYDWDSSDVVRYRFPPPGQVTEGMAFVPVQPLDSLYLPGLRQVKDEPTGPFAMDRYEVTNRDFRRFMDAGGYTDPKYWRQTFLEGGRRLTLKEALARFTDRTGRPGPATWEVGSYPEGREEYPVSGVSWYEAAAYAEWAGKSLPTVFHWNLVACTPASAWIVPVANLDGSGPVPVGSTKSANRFGVSDLAGNVREWVWNASDGGQERFILGGGWNDPGYAFSIGFAQPSLDRSPTNGFRCIRYLEKEPNLSALQRSIKRQVRDFKAERPVSDAVFAQYLRQFTYDKTPLDARIEEVKTTATGVRQKISFNAAYGGERMLAYLFLPPEGKPPYQVVVFFPGAGALYRRSSKALDLGVVDFLPRSGRAVMYPIYKGTFERARGRGEDSFNGMAAYKDGVIMWAKDLARTIDYLETRKDIDTDRIAYYGFSWGARMGSIMPAVEKRIKVNVLLVAGLGFGLELPEVDAFNYVTRVKQPTLMLNGEWDFFYPRETSQRPMFELLGTPAADKKWLLFPGGHSVPRTEMIKESLAWLDHYLGPVGPTQDR